MMQIIISPTQDIIGTNANYQKLCGTKSTKITSQNVARGIVKIQYEYIDSMSPAEYQDFSGSHATPQEVPSSSTSTATSSTTTCRERLEEFRMQKTGK